MGVTCNYNCTDLTDHEQVLCGDYSKGGFSTIGILACDHTITDFSSATEAQTAIDNGTLNLIKGIKAQIPEPSPIENPNPIGCGSETILDGFERTVSWMDSNVNSANIIFYNALNTRNEFLIIYNCNDDPNDEGIITVIEATNNFVAFRVGPESNKERQFFNVTAKYTKFDESPIFTAPTDIYQ